MAQLGGGLGDIFNKLYEYHQYQILPFAADKAIVDCLVTCCNPAVKSVVESLLSVNGNPVFRDIIYRDLFWGESDEYKELTLVYRNKGYLFIDDEQGRESIFALSGLEVPEQYGYFRRYFYRHKYALTYQEQGFFDSMPEKYIVIHPSGGLQAVDGLTRTEYAILIELLLGDFPELTFVAIGASHRRDFGTKDYDCAGCDNTAAANGTCLKDNTKICIRYKEDAFDIQHPHFIDLTNKTSGALCANIVEKAQDFIGSHSAWMNFFWHFNKPTVCVLSNDTKWGDAQNYVLTNGCRWGFSLTQTAVVPVDPNTETQRHGEDKRKAILYEVYNQVIMELKWKIANGNLQNT
jgi:hypothetical protein